MSAKLHAADYAVIVVMLIISAAIGLYFRFTGDRQRTTTEFLMAGRNMNIIPVIFSLVATAYSAVSILGISADVYLYGAITILSNVGYCIGGIFSVYALLPVYFDMDVCTTYEYLERRFGKVTRYITSLLFCVQMILYNPIILYAPSLALSTVTGLSLWTSVTSIAVVCTFYSSLGGLKAVLWTDLFQSILMFITLFSVIIKGSLDIGGFDRVYEIAEDSGRLSIFNPSVSFIVRYTTWNCLIHGFIDGIYDTGASHFQVQRLMSVKTVKRSQKSYLLSIPVNFLLKFLCCWSGAVIYSYFYNCDPLQDTNSDVKKGDQMFPYLVLKLFAHLPGMPGLCVAGIFSASLSTMSSSLNALAAVSLEDIIKPLTKGRNLKDSTASCLAKTLALVYGGLSILLVFVVLHSKEMKEVTVLLYSLVSGPTLGVYLLGMFTSSANETGTLIGLLSGFSLHAWMAFGSLYKRPKHPSLPLTTEGCGYNNSSMYLENDSNRNYTFFSSTGKSTDGFIEEGYIFPLYRISFMWFTTISLLTVICVGYASSLLIGIWKKQPSVDPQTFSPVIQKQISRIPRREKDYMPAPLSSNQVELKKMTSHFEDDDAQ